MIFGPRSSRRTRRRRQTEEPSPLFISDIYQDIHHIAGPIVDSLVDTDRMAAGRLLDATLYASPLLRGLVALIEHLNRLTELPGLDADVGGLFRQSSENIYEGIKACIYAPGPRVMDQSRFLMEVEFLLYDLTARPESLDEWRTAEPFLRNQRFGFGRLRSRREQDLGFAPARVLADRDEYSVHSALVHPRPARELLEPDETAQARQFFLISDLADLFSHATRVANAAISAVEAFLAEDHRVGQQNAGRPQDLAPVTQAHEFVETWHMSLGYIAPPRPESVPTKRPAAGLLSEEVAEPSLEDPPR